MALNLGELQVEVSADTKNADANIKKFQGTVNKTGTDTTRSTKQMSSGFATLTKFINPTTIAIAGFGTATAAATKFITSSIARFKQAEVAQVTQAQLIRATGEAAGFTQPQLEAMAQSLDANSLASTQGAREAQNLLLTFNKIQGEVFPRTLTAAQDLAASGFGTLEGNAIQLGKALQDPKTGISALTRVGITFSDSQKETIKNLQSQNKLFEAQGVILEALESQVGGAGKAQADTFAGSLDAMDQAWGNLQETTGEWFLELTDGRGKIDVITDSLITLDKWIRRVTGSMTEAELTAELDEAKKSYNAIQIEIQATEIKIARLKRQQEESGSVWTKIYNPALAEAINKLEELKKESATAGQNIAKTADDISIAQKKSAEEAADEAIKQLDRVKVHFSTIGPGIVKIVEDSGNERIEIEKEISIQSLIAYTDYYNSKLQITKDGEQQIQDAITAVPSSMNEGSIGESEARVEHVIDENQKEYESEQKLLAQKQELADQQASLLEDEIEGIEKVTNEGIANRNRYIENQKVNAKKEAEIRKKLSEQEKKDENDRLIQMYKVNKMKERAARDTFGSIANSMLSFANIADGTTKEGFRLQKAAALGQAIISGALAAVNAWNRGMEQGFIGGPALAGAYLAASLAATGAQVAAIASQSFPGRQFGGSVSSGGRYRVNETGEPELLSVGNKDYLMMGNKSGHVTSARDMKGNAPRITINNNAVNAVVRTPVVTDAGDVILEIENKIVEGIQDGTSPLSQELQHTYGLKRAGSF